MLTISRFIVDSISSLLYTLSILLLGGFTMKSKISIHDCTRISLLAALIAVSSYIIIPLPFSPVPVTGQTLAIMLCALLLTPSQSTLTLSIYLLLGIIGLPVFAGGSSGIGVILGPTGGFLIGFLPMACFISFFKGSSPNMLRYFLVSGFSSLILLNLIGVPWLAYSAGISFSQAIALGFLPFLPGGILKLFLAVLLAWKLIPQLSFMTSNR